MTNRNFFFAKKMHIDLLKKKSDLRCETKQCRACFIGTVYFLGICQGAVYWWGERYCRSVMACISAGAGLIGVCFEGLSDHPLCKAHQHILFIFYISIQKNINNIKKKYWNGSLVFGSVLKPRRRLESFELSSWYSHKNVRIF